MATTKKPAAGKKAGGNGAPALNEKHKRFVDEYLIDLNATQAAVRAGYSEKTAGSQGFDLLKKPEIQQYLTERMAAREKRTEITQDKVLKELAKIGFADIRRAVKWGESVLVHAEDDEGGNPVELKHTVALLSSTEIDDDTAAAIAEVSQGRDGVKLKMHDKKGALVDIGRHLGMFKDKVEVSGNDGGAIVQRIELVALDGNGAD
ncbi:MAG: hypothetical protein H6R01_443 [Burkholderiaceae bacterium]|nr:hypothetical protein [Burkholderiaceae bacterium]